ncbi:MAG TPA: hypothetical protein VK636_22955, partial [Gemmatimonadaceae bacterium]|nr:hypothetical protein [Gemmatimonadaceae bacterium]
MGAVAVENLDTRAKLDVFAEDANGRPAFNDAAAECVLGLKPNDEDRVARVRRAGNEMMENASSFHHSRSRDHDQRPDAMVE